jgi:type I site-specific restriction endonuclease
MKKATPVKKNFGIYVFQFDKNFNNKEAKIKKFDTTMIGEIDMTSKTYENLSLEEACRKRIEDEASSKCGLSDVELRKSIRILKCYSITSDLNAGVDKKIHAILKKTFGKTCIKVGKSNTEMFNLGSNPLEIIDEAVQRLTGNFPRKEFSPRTLQQKCIDQINKYFQKLDEKQKKEFLIFAVCRFGKTSTALYSLITQLKLKNILILTSKCDTENSWYSDFYEWDFNEGFNFITKDTIKKDESCLNKDNKVCFMSFQTAADTEDDANVKVDKKWCEKLAKTKWDAIIIDECHFGAATLRSESLIKMIFDSNSEVVKLELSATPYKLINEGKYKKENSFIFTLMDEPKYLKKSVEYVPVEMYHLNINKFKYTSHTYNKTKNYVTFKKLAEFFNTTDFSWMSMFEEFNSDELGMIVNDLYQRVVVKRKGAKNLAIVVNNINHGDKLSDGLKNYNQYTVYNVCGNSKTSLGEINAAMEENDGKPVIIITCGRYMTGTTMKRLDSVMFMRDVHSAETYVQYMLRAKNLFEGRTSACNVFDLSPNSFMYSDAFNNLIISEAKARAEAPEKIAKEYAECISLFEVDGFNIVSPVKDFSKKFESNFYSSKSNKQQLNVGNYFEDNFISSLSPEIISLLCNTRYKKGTILTKGTSVTKAKLKTKSQKNRSDNKPDKKLNIVEIRCALIELLSHIPTFMKHEELTDINEIFNRKELFETFKYWMNGFSVENLQLMKDLFEKNLWESFGNDLTVTRQNLPDDRDKWQYDSPRPVNNFKIF